MSTLRVAYFAHDWHDAAIRRRVAAFQADGLEVAGFAMTRLADEAPGWVAVPLGQTRDNAYLQRITSIIGGARRAAGQRDLLARADVVVARNLDMLATAMLALRQSGIDLPVVYECLDIHRFLAREGRIGTVFRWAERALLKRSAALWVSSPGFLRHYFEPMHPGMYHAELIENRITPDPALGPRPASTHKIGSPLRLGWFGNLRCPRSMDLLTALARRFGDRVALEFHGYPAMGEIPDFEARVAAEPNITYGGRYRAPGDLAQLYGQVDLVWSGDFMDAGLNSDWLLPNRIYEGGWFACPPVAPEACETGRWITKRASGLTVAEPIEDSLPALIERLLHDPDPLIAARNALLSLPDETFLQPPGTMRALIEDSLLRGR